MKSLLPWLVVLIVTSAVRAQTLTVEVPINGGLLAFVGRGDNLAIDGVDIVSAPGKLIPVSPSDTAAPSDPFAFLVSNTASQVTFGSIGTTVPFPDGVCATLGVGVEPGVIGSDIVVAWGTGTAPVFADLFFKDVTCASVPEPSVASLLLCGLLFSPLLPRRIHRRRM